MGNHCIDLLEMFFGPVNKVSCFTNRIHGYASEDSAVVLLHFGNGALGTVDTFFCIPDTSSKNALELYGSEGSILATGTIGQGSQGQMTAYLQSGAGYRPQQARDAEKGVKIEPEAKNIYRSEIEAFSQALIEGKPNPLSADLGLHSQKVIAACYESARAGAAVKVSG
jgi:predicted dehydrogenase